ncbi:MAG: helix-turn-helix domain-containing protein [Devosia sp.]
MEFALHFPQGRLAAFVESITFYAGYAPRHDREKLIPDGAIQIIVDLTDRPKRLYAGETTPLGVDFTRSWISGMQQRWIVIEAQQAASMLVIRFQPGGAQALIRHDAGALANSVYPLVSVINGAAASLRDRVLEAPSITGKFAAAEGWLGEQLAGASLHACAPQLAARLLLGGQRVRDLAAETGLSERHLRNIFAQAIGVSPKQFARIGRFQRVVGELARSGRDDPALTGEALPGADWAQLAVENGYADQSHLSHEFVAFAGMTPKAYAAAYRGLSNYLPITLAR